MLKFWVRSISLGLLAAIAIIMVTPSLRAKLMPVVEQPRNIGALQISFNEAVRKAAPAVVNIYNRKYSENDRRKLSIQGLGSGVIVSEKATSSPTTTSSRRPIKLSLLYKMGEPQQHNWWKRLPYRYCRITRRRHGFTSDSTQSRLPS